MITSPVAGFLIGALLMYFLFLVLQRFSPHFVQTLFGKLQILSAAFMAHSHGTNDAQKTMGIILMLLTTAGHKQWASVHHHILWHEHNVALWIILSCTGAMALGTMFGGWRIVKTMGSKLTRLQPVGGICAESAAAAALFFTSAQGIPVSTTHTITGAIVGVGSLKRLSAPRWRIAGQVLWAWVLTIPGSAALAALAGALLSAAG